MPDAQSPTTTLFFGNLHDKVDRKILYEIAVQAGPVVDVIVVADPGGKCRGFGFVVRILFCRPMQRHPRRPCKYFVAGRLHRAQTPCPRSCFQDYETLESAMYAKQLFNGNIRLFGRDVRLDYSPKGRTS
jgi:hypothetical protein